MEFNESYEKAIIKLVKMGKSKGFVSEKDIKDIIPEDVLNIAFDSIYATLVEQGIDIVSE